MVGSQRWRSNMSAPDSELVLVRHGESTGNVARERAESSNSEVIAVEERDADVPLSPLGERQSAALGRLLTCLPDHRQPTTLWCSPYLRAQQTAEIALTEAELAPECRFDERLRDRELGILDRLTRRGVAARFPQEAARKRRLGKFYYRPPGGESWADVALRLRSVLGELDSGETPYRALVISHEAVIMLIRYICEGLSEHELLNIAAGEPVGNCAVTVLRKAPGSTRWQLDLFNHQEHLQRADSRPTQHPGDREVACRRRARRAPRESQQLRQGPGSIAGIS
jgi:broad specificity phosphatase PhoE